MANTLDRDYLELCRDILQNGVVKSSRTGVNTRSVFGRTIRFSTQNMFDKFPILTTKHVSFANVSSELLWFLRGRSDLRFLLERGNKIWVGDAYKKFGEKFGASLTRDEFIQRIRIDDLFSETWGDLGQVYGVQWRSWRKDEGFTSPDGIQYHIDQIKVLIDTLKNNPDSRRMLVSAWNVSDMEEMVLPPCHHSFQVYTRKLSIEERWSLLRRRIGEKAFKDLNEDLVPFGGGLSESLQDNNIPVRAISLLWNQRSVDVPLGLPYNITSYALLLCLLAKEVNMVPQEIIGCLGDVHIYENQIEGIEEQLTREPKSILPKLKIHLGTSSILDEDWDIENLDLDNYEHHPSIKMPLSN